MEGLISAAEKSRTNMDMVASGSIIPYTEFPVAINSSGSQHQIVPPYINVNGNAGGQSMTLQFPPGAGFITNFSLQDVVTYTIGADDVPEAPVAYNKTRQIEFVSGGNVIVHRTGKSMLCSIMKSKNRDLQRHALDNARMLVPGSEVLAVAGQTSFVTYLTFDESFLTGPERFLLLSAVDLQLRVTYEFGTRAGLVADNYTVVPRLFLDTYMPPQDIYSKMVLKDWTEVKTHEMTNSHTEFGTITSPTTAYITINSSFLASQTHIAIQQSVSQPLVAAVVGPPAIAEIPAEYGNRFYKIHSLSMTLNGRPFFDNWPVSRINEIAYRNHNSLAPTGIEYNDNIVTINWGILCDRFRNSGVAHWQKLLGTRIDIVFEPVRLVGNVEMVVAHDLFDLVQYNPSTAGGYLKISSVN